ncbi:MAG: M24 family metallopeptidase [Planctomycetota bacterium]
MSISIRTQGEIDAIEAAGTVCVEAIEAGFAAAGVGATTASVCEVIADFLSETRARSAILGFRDGNRRFPAVACVSVNEQLPPAVPGARVIADGDVITIDLAVSFDGWCADAATSRVVGERRVFEPRLTEARALLLEAIGDLVPGREWPVAQFTRCFTDAGFTVAPGPLGHGIGRRVHESPALAGPVRESRDGRGLGGDRDRAILWPGMVFAIEPIWSIGDWPKEVLGEDGWTTVTADGSIVWTEERTVAMTAAGPRVLTRFPADSSGKG